MWKDLSRRWGMDYFLKAASVYDRAKEGLDKDTHKEWWAKKIMELVVQHEDGLSKKIKKGEQVVQQPDLARAVEVMEALRNDMDEKYINYWPRKIIDKALKAEKPQIDVAKQVMATFGNNIEEKHRSYFARKIAEKGG